MHKEKKDSWEGTQSIPPLVRAVWKFAEDCWLEKWPSWGEEVLSEDCNNKILPNKANLK